VPPVPRTAPPVASRLGLDLNPGDVTDPETTRWLEACVWPDVPGRLQRLRAAIDLVRTEPPELRKGNAVDLVTDAVLAVPVDAVACLDSTWVLAYFSGDERARLHEILDDLGADRTIAYVTAEYPDNAPWVPPAPRPDRRHRAHRPHAARSRALGPRPNRPPRPRLGATARPVDRLARPGSAG
jgi:hypothetical protein